jgi:hypothetical protein
MAALTSSAVSVSAFSGIAASLLRNSLIRAASELTAFYRG